MVDNPYCQVVDIEAMKRRPMIGPEATKLPALAQHPSEDKGSFRRDIIGRPYRIEIPWADMTASQIRALAEDMLEAWQRVAALTHREDLTPYDLILRCRSAVREGAIRLPKRRSGRAIK